MTTDKMIFVKPGTLIHAGRDTGHGEDCPLRDRGSFDNLDVPQLLPQYDGRGGLLRDLGGGKKTTILTPLAIVDVTDDEGFMALVKNKKKHRQPDGRYYAVLNGRTRDRMSEVVAAKGLDIDLPCVIHDRSDALATVVRVAAENTARKSISSMEMLGITLKVIQAVPEGERNSKSKMLRAAVAQSIGGGDRTHRDYINVALSMGSAIDGKFNADDAQNNYERILKVAPDARVKEELWSLFVRPAEAGFKGVQAFLPEDREKRIVTFIAKSKAGKRGAKQVESGAMLDPIGKREVLRMADKLALPVDKQVRKVSDVIELLDKTAQLSPSFAFQLGLMMARCNPGNEWDLRTSKAWLDIFENDEEQAKLAGKVFSGFYDYATGKPAEGEAPQLSDEEREAKKQERLKAQRLAYDKKVAEARAPKDADKPADELLAEALGN